MEKEFVPYELALKLKELGFNEKCFGWWSYINGTTASFYGYHCTNSELIELNSFNKNCTAPLWQQAFDWFRESYGLCNFINHSGGGYCSGWEDLGNNEHGFGNYNTYEEARLECLKKLIKIVKKKS